MIPAKNSIQTKAFRPLLILFAVVYSCAQPKGIWVETLKCDHKIQAVGINDNPSFSWILNSSERNQNQTAYQLKISTDKKLRDDDPATWNSGIITSNRSIGIHAGNVGFKPGTRYYWKVRVWDKNSIKSRWSKTGSFVTALFGKEDWSGAKWISLEKMRDSLILVPGIPTFGRNTSNIALRRPVIPLFRKEFLIEKKIESACLFISGLGHYKAYINGEPVSDDFLSQGWTHYQKTCQYNTYDITHAVRRGNNAIGIIVGNGFHNINNERYRKLLITYGVPKTIAKIRITYSDGSEVTLVTGPDWKSAPSPVTFTSIYGGETYDARLEQTGWATPDFDDSEWQNALIAKNPQGNLRPETSYPVKIMESFRPKRIFKTGKDSFMIDFGQNASGIIRLKVKGNRGDTIRIIPSELINEDYSANQQATGSPYYYEYILKGDGIETWQPMFTYYGFRYIQVYGARSLGYIQKHDTPELVEITMHHTCNSAPHTGSFWCSNKLFNRIDTLIRYGIQSNFQSVLTDCPHREKLGWLEQTYLMGNAIQHSYELYHLYQKIVRDMVDSQRESGLIGNIAPEYVVFGDAFTDSPEWGSAIVILPWLVYKWYGDISLMEEAWESMIAYVNYLDSKSKHHILAYGLGDWFDLGPERPGLSQLSPLETTATAIYYYDYILLARMAEKLNKSAEINALMEKAELIREAYNKLLFDPEKGVYGTGSQTSMAIPLSLGMVDNEYYDLVLNNLVDSIMANNKAFTAGDIGFYYLLDALTKGDQSQLICDMNNRDDVPGYGYQLKRGATALTESWSALPNVSNNHLMLGHLEEWFFTGPGGIRQEDNSVAYKNSIIQPTLVEGIDAVKTMYDTPYGRIKSEWKKENNAVYFTIEIPANTSATVNLPARDPKSVFLDGISLMEMKDLRVNISEKKYMVLKIGSGSYHFTVEKNEEKY